MLIRNFAIEEPKTKALPRTMLASDVLGNVGIVEIVVLSPLRLHGCLVLSFEFSGDAVSRRRMQMRPEGTLSMRDNFAIRQSAISKFEDHFPDNP